MILETLERSGMMGDNVKIAPFLMFDGKVEEAMTFCTSLFEDSGIVSVTRYGADGAGYEGMVERALYLPSAGGRSCA